MKATIRLGRIAGIDVGLHYSWFLVLGLMSWSLAERFLPAQYVGWSTASYWAAGIVAALLLFASVLIHELAHSVLARARGFPVHGITLFLLGGVSNIKAEARRPRDEFAISAVGPVSSLVLAGIFGLAVRGVQDTNSPLAAVLVYLALINLLLAGFNLLPAFPLDGGRVLRSIVWATTGDLSKATTIATWGGRVVGMGLAGVGVFQMLQGSLLGGLWLAFIGWFLNSTAIASKKKEMEAQAGFRGILVKDVMEREPETIDANVTIADAVFGYFLPKGYRAMPVCRAAEFAGIVTLTDIKNVPQSQWRWLALKDVMTPMPLQSLRPDDELPRALELLERHDFGQAPVLDEGRLVGLLTRAGLRRHISSRKELGIESGPDSVARPKQ